MEQNTEAKQREAVVHERSLPPIPASVSSYCEQAVSLMDEFAKNGYNIQTISVAQYPDTIKQLNITQLPAFILIQDNKIVDRVDGGSAPVVLKPMIQGMFDRVDRTARKNITTNTSIAPPVIPTLTQTSISTPILNPTTASSNSTNTDIDLLNRKFITSSVKLRVDSANGHSWGSGTIVDTRGGDALILTCGHIFREAGITESNGKIIVEVHLYGENSSVKVYGRCIYYDLEIDLAFVVIVPPCPVQAIPVAPANFTVSAGQNVISVGCDGGADPTIRKHSIMSIDRIGTPPSNKLPFHYVQVSGAPVGGRSGGGLFSDNGYLIGVCNTADPIRDDGHFVPPEIIRKLLDQQKLSVVYENPSLKSTKPNNKTEIANNQIKNLNSATPQPLNLPPAISSSSTTLSSSPLPEIAKPLLPFASQPNLSANLNPNQKSIPNSQTSTLPESDNLTPVERATLCEIKRRAQDGDEVILIIRSKRNLEMPSDVIVLNNTSEKFIDNLIQQSPTRYAAQSEKTTENQIILSSHENQPPVPQPHPVTFNVPHK
jgi:hypothetical protein